MTTKQELREEIRLQEGLVAYFRDLWLNDRAELERLKEDAKINILELKQEESRADELGAILGKITNAFKSDSYIQNWSELPCKVGTLVIHAHRLEKDLEKHKPVWRGADQFPPVDENCDWCSVDVLLSVPDSSLPVVAYYDFNCKRWIGFHTGNMLYVNNHSEWTLLPQK